ncbi:MAG: UvrD-helicase domain-containing protein, partial [Beijerinckiaceae bacterium]
MSLISPEQRKAADPRHSVWVSANAGSGKTTVLTARVVRLLLAGADPARILCVTFTKAAAANMQNKIFEALGAWVALDDARLAAAIETMTGEPLRPGDLPKARRLFARAVETPGGLKIQTIHGFCERLLHLFPFEAGVPARFKVLDDAEQSAITEAAITATLNTALTDSSGSLGKALIAATSAAGEGGFRDALREFMRHRREPASPLLETKFAVSPLRQKLGIKPGETAENTEREVLTHALYSTDWRAIRDWLRSSGKARDKDMAEALEAGSGAQGEQKLTSYVSVFLTESLQPRPDKGFFISAELRKARNDLTETMLAERERVHTLMQKRNAIAAVDRTEAIIALADAVNARYRAEKRRLGRLDFPDLIGKVVTLLTEDTAKWVLYKLDQGLDHVLVDEAQDTSPEQWAIVKAISDDFFAGEGARP